MAQGGTVHECVLLSFVCGDALQRNDADDGARGDRKAIRECHPVITRKAERIRYGFKKNAFGRCFGILIQKVYFCCNFCIQHSGHGRDVLQNAVRLHFVDSRLVDRLVIECAANEFERHEVVLQDLELCGLLFVFPNKLKSLRAGNGLVKIGKIEVAVHAPVVGPAVFDDPSARCGRLVPLSKSTDRKVIIPADDRHDVGGAAFIIYILRKDLCAVFRLGGAHIPLVKNRPPHGFAEFNIRQRIAEVIGSYQHVELLARQGFQIVSFFLYVLQFTGDLRNVHDLFVRQLRGIPVTIHDLKARDLILIRNVGLIRISGQHFFRNLIPRYDLNGRHVSGKIRDPDRSPFEQLALDHFRRGFAVLIGTSPVISRRGQNIGILQFKPLHEAKFLRQAPVSFIIYFALAVRIRHGSFVDYADTGGQHGRGQRKCSAKVVAIDPGSFDWV